MTHPEALSSALDALATERIAPEAANLDCLSTSEQVELMMRHAHDAVAAVAACHREMVRAVDAIVERRARGGRLIYAGAGTAGRIGVLDASEIPPTFGADPGAVVGVIAGGEVAVRHAVENAEDDPDAGARALDEIAVRATDVVVGISASGRTPYVLGALAFARERGAFTISLACNVNAAISAGVDVAIEVETGPELVAGSTRLKAGTAQKLVVNTLSTLAMVQDGKVLGNLMVDVQATNAKLRVRAQRIVMHATGCTAERAKEALEAADGSAKLAILSVASGAPLVRVRRALDDAQGHPRAALEILRTTANPVRGEDEGS